jgi:adenine-specific DNA-methyltransferase
MPKARTKRQKQGTPTKRTSANGQLTSGTTRAVKAGSSTSQSAKSKTEDRTTASKGNKRAKAKARKGDPRETEKRGIADLVNSTTNAPGGPGMYLHWEGRKGYRTRMPTPRVLEPIDKLSFGDPGGNRLIEGDNLQVMISLRSQYRGAVDAAYLDPPYNTGKKDFRYSDRRFRDPNADSDDAVYVSNEDGGRHTKWLNFMGPRLYLVWELLADHGVCFVSISDIELFRLGLLMDEIFGESNRLGVVVWRQMADNNPTRIAVGHEYILCYAKNIDNVPPVWTGHSGAKDWMLETYERLKAETEDIDNLQKHFQKAIKEHVAAYHRSLETGKDVGLVDLGELDRYKFVDDRGPYAAVRDTAVHAGASHPGLFYDIVHPNGEVCKKPGSGYRFKEERMQQFKAEGRLIFGKNHNQLVQLKKYVKDISPPLRGIIDIDSRKGSAVLKKLFPGGAQRFNNPKPVELIMQLLEFGGNIDALVLDPFAGSGTTAHAVLRLNERDGGARRFMLIEEGSKDDRYCRTLTAPRIKAVIEKENLDGGFAFETMGRRLNRDAILELEREAIANLIIQTDATGKGRGISKVNGTFVVGHNTKQEAICLCWNGRTKSRITRDVLVKMFDEAKKLGLRRPLRAYGATCDVGETESFRFCQIPDEILAALQLDEADEALSGDPDAVERLETAALTAANGRR